MTTNSNGKTPDYIKALLAPTKNSRGSRRAWSIDVESVWVPFFTATNVMGETNLPDDVLGAPIRLAKSPDGDVRFTQSGRPVMRVHPELNAQIGIVRENFVAGLQAYTGAVQNERPDAYGVQVANQQAAGMPILEQDQTDILEAVEILRKQAEAEAAEGEHAPEDGKAEEKATQSRSRSNTSEKPEPEPATTPAS
ncbi:MAG: hypothetical protein ACE5Q6_09420 [Dehalococcoidia bacterium]